MTSRCAISDLRLRTRGGADAGRYRQLELADSRGRRGFTLIEVLVAVAILAMAMSLVAMIYSNTISAWRLAQGEMDELHQGDFVIEQVVGALRSAAFFPNNPKKYGFWLKDQGTQSSAHDEISFVTSSSAFIPTDSPMQNSLHRLFVGTGSDKSGHEGLAIRAAPHMKKDLDPDSLDVWIVSSRVSAFDCQVYDFDTKDWTDIWENTNKIPNLVKVTMTIKPVHEDDPPLVVSRIVQIPLSEASLGKLGTASPAAGGTNAAVGPGGMIPYQQGVGVGLGVGNIPGRGSPVPGGNSNNRGGGSSTHGGRSGPGNIPFPSGPGPNPGSGPGRGR